MIATILPSSANFHAVNYSERKIAKGVARLLEMKNFGSVGVLSPATTEDKVAYLRAYSAVNSRVQKAQFHLAVSCKGHEMTEEQLLEFAHAYLKEMGYGEDGQPLLVYSHYDTGNTHLHIVTSRIGPDGRKINDHNERIRSQAVIDQLLGNDREKKVDRDIEKAKGYTFSSLAQLKAVFATMGYKAYEKNDELRIKKGGRIVAKLPVSEIEPLYKPAQRSRARNRQLRSILLKYRDTCTDKKQLQKELKSRFGIDIAFFGNADNPYGYMIVDHANKTVINGARVLKTELLLDFATPEERLDRIDTYIDRLLSNDPKIDTWSINEKLRSSRAYIRRGVLHFNGTTRPLKEHMASAILRNDKIKRIEAFKPISETERNFLCRIYGVDRADLVELSSERSVNYASMLDTIREAFDDESVGIVRQALRPHGITIHQDGDNCFAVDFTHHTIVNLADEGFDISRLYRRPNNGTEQRKSKRKKQSKSNKSIKPVRNPLRDVGGGSNSEKREWEVGHKSNYEDIDDGHSLKMG